MAFQRVARPVGLDVREATELAAPDPRQLERHERLQQRTLPSGRSARAASHETHAAAGGRDALEQLARVAIGALVQHETALEQNLFALGHYTSKPSR